MQEDKAHLLSEECRAHNLSIQGHGPSAIGGQCLTKHAAKPGRTLNSDRCVKNVGSQLPTATGPGIRDPVVMIVAIG